MPKKTAPKKYTWANTSPSFKTWFNKYYPGIDYDTLYSEDKFLVRKKFDKNLKPVNGHLTVTEVQRDAIRKTTEGFSDFSKKYGGDIAKLKSALQSNPDRFYDALKKAGINVYMVGDQYRFANTGPTNINKFKSAFEIKLKYSVAQLNKAAQTKHNLNFKQLTDGQQDNIRAQLSQGVKIKKRTVFTPLPKGSQIKVLQEFPDANFDLSKHGYDPTTVKGKGQNINVKNYIDRGFKLRDFKPLSKPTQQRIIGKFSEIPKDQWDFKRFQYGLPWKDQDTLLQRIRTHAADPKPWRYAFQLKSPGAWMLAQMDRAITDHGDTRFKSLLNENGRVIGMKDNGVAYYANRNVAPSNFSKLITSHPNFNEVQKIIDIAARANTPLTKLKDAPSRALVELFPEGFNAKNLSLNRLLAYAYKHKGLEATKAAIQLHHIEALKAGGDPISAKNIQPLRRDLNMLGETIDKSIRGTSRKLPTLERVPELTEAGVKVKVGDVVYGGGTQNISKILKQETEALYEPLSKYKPRDWKSLQSWITKSFATGSAADQFTIAKVLKCPVTKAEGGRIGYALGTATINCVTTKLREQPLESTKALSTLDEGATGILGKIRNTAKGFLGALGRFGPAAGKYGAIAAAGAVAQPLVKQFMSDDPSTYLTDPDQQAGLLDALIEGERPKPRSEILDWGMGAGQLGATAAAVPGSGALYKYRRGLSEAKIPKAGPVSEAGLTAGEYLSKHKQKLLGGEGRGVAPQYGKLRAGAGVGMKLLSGMFTPAGLLATEPLRIAQQRREGESWGEIATDPFTWMGPAFAPSMTKIATAGMKKGSLLPRLLRLGISRGALAAMGPVGWVGLAASLGWEGRKQYSDYKKGRGFFASDED